MVRNSRRGRGGEAVCHLGGSGFSLSCTCTGWWCPLLTPSFFAHLKPKEVSAALGIKPQSLPMAFQAFCGRPKLSQLIHSCCSLTLALGETGVHSFCCLFLAPYIYYFVCPKSCLVFLAKAKKKKNPNRLFFPSPDGSGHDICDIWLPFPTGHSSWSIKVPHLLDTVMGLGLDM